MDTARLILCLVALSSVVSQTAAALSCDNQFPFEVASVVVDGVELPPSEYPDHWLDGNFWLTFEPTHETPCTIEVGNYPDWVLLAETDSC